MSNEDLLLTVSTTPVRRSPSAATWALFIMGHSLSMPAGSSLRLVTSRNTPTCLSAALKVSYKNTEEVVSLKRTGPQCGHSLSQYPAFEAQATGGRCFFLGRGWQGLYPEAAYMASLERST